MAELRKEGYIVGVVERWVAAIKRRQDLFQFVDLLAVGHGKIIAVQVTKEFLKEHIEKIHANPKAKIWLQSGGLIHIHLWRERKRQGRKEWLLDVVEITK